MAQQKQAVLLIHGIGEQRPMDSLRSFVNAVWPTDKGVQRLHGPDKSGVWSKPYTLSESFELRRLTTAENRNGRRTDFFELYWAHLLEGTKLGHLRAWVKTLLWRRPSTVPKHLRVAYVAVLMLVSTAGVMLAWSAIAESAGDRRSVWISLAISGVVLPLIVGVLSNTVGDAARYLHIAPTNVQRRHEIRAAGVKVLKALHEAKEDDGSATYDRIIVVGHSLGSVIGYDVLYHTWSSYNRDEPEANSPIYRALTELEHLAESLGSSEGEVDAIQLGQRQYLNEMKANHTRWRVTDFLTLGSPLAHAEILLAHNATDLRSKMRDRELPRCLPELESGTRNGVSLSGFSYPLGADKRTPHHAAVFGPTRWTNLYFPNTWLLRGDLIGGRLQPIFGVGVKDIPVKTKLRSGWLTHTLYWTAAKEGSNPHIEALRNALDLLDTRNGRSASEIAPQN
jgi:hypothetical protein